MPVYEYRCLSCGKEFEYQQRMADPAKTVCEACGGELERLISRTAFQLKGGGWYKDLYASTKPDSGGGDAKTESKPAATDSKPAATDSKPAATESKPAATESKPAATGTGTGTGSGTGTGTGSSGGTT